MRLTKLGGIVVFCFALPLISACSDKANRLALSSTGEFTQDQNPLSDSFMVGEVTGGSVPILDPYGISNEEYKEALTLSLRANHLLAENPQTAKYRIDATLDFDRSGIFDKEVDADIDYRLLSNATLDVLFEKKIQSKATSKSPLKEKAGVVVALLFTSKQEIGAEWQADFLVAARDNLTKFFDVLSSWTPPSKAEAPVSEARPHGLVVPSCAFQRRLAAQMPVD